MNASISETSFSDLFIIDLGKQLFWSFRSDRTVFLSISQVKSISVFKTIKISLFQRLEFNNDWGGTPSAEKDRVITC